MKSICIESNVEPWRGPAPRRATRAPARLPGGPGRRLVMVEITPAKHPNSYLSC